MPNADHDSTLICASRRLRRDVYPLVLLVAALPWSSALAADRGKTQFRTDVEPILTELCLGCHNAQQKKGSVTLDDFESGADRPEHRDLWLRALKMVRAGLMPPKNRPQPTAEQVASLERWIKGSAFGLDPRNPDPGRVTVRRLNRTEYRNTVRDLVGVDFDTDGEFPADDTGHGFDNIGDVLSLSPLLLEKYIAASRSIVARAVPTVAAVPAERRVAGGRFRDGGDGPLSLSYYTPAKVRTAYKVEHAGRYQLVVDLSASERFVDGVFDYNKCRLVFKADGKVLLNEQFTRQGNKPYRFEFDQEWKPGEHELAFELEPLTPKAEQVRSLTLRVAGVTVRGPLDDTTRYVPPPNYRRFFPKPVPAGPAERSRYARELLAGFATKAFRRPADDETVARLTALAESVAARPGQTFESGVAQAMTVVLASPRFLFREEGDLPAPEGTHPDVDEHALASRLSYFLWSTMPDDQLTFLATAGQLRKNLSAQLQRMLADPRSNELVRHFVGQWLQARDIDTVEINARAVITRDEPPDPKAQARFQRFRELIRKPPESLTDQEKKELAEARKGFFGGRRRFAQFELNGDLRRAMRRETEMLFDHVLRNDRSLVELIDSNYTFLNERLARHYGIEGVRGDEMRRVDLPPGSPRGGVLTHGTVLAVTSNPDRTSPVKRGLFILDNILGTPPPPPPPDIPALEEAETAAGGKPTTVREAMKLHRSQPLCNSCHNRMDPLGLALEHFNALGRFRDKERGQPVDAAGQLLTGEAFTTVQELKRILVNERRRDFYRCLTEKLLTYALGRGLEYYDVQTVDDIVARVEQAGGRPSALLTSVVESVPFQKRRAAGASAAPAAGSGQNQKGD
jgi:hypothetical protein